MNKYRRYMVMVALISNGLFRFMLDRSNKNWSPFGVIFTFERRPSRTVLHGSPSPGKAVSRRFAVKKKSLSNLEPL